MNVAHASVVVATAILWASLAASAEPQTQMIVMNNDHLALLQRNSLFSAKSLDESNDAKSKLLMTLAAFPDGDIARVSISRISVQGHCVRTSGWTNDLTPAGGSTFGSRKLFIAEGELNKIRDAVETDFQDKNDIPMDRVVVMRILKQDRFISIRIDRMNLPERLTVLQPYMPILNHPMPRDPKAIDAFP